MSIEFRKINVIGTVGRDAEVRHTPNGNVNVQFSIASNMKRGDEEIVNWFRVTFWGTRAEKVAQWITKGKLVAVSGDFIARDYVDKDGNNRYSLDINANDVALLSRNENGNGAAVEEADDDIPF